MSEFKNLTLEVADGIAVLAISRPAALNALNSETLDELNVCLSEIEANDGGFELLPQGVYIMKCTSIKVGSTTRRAKDTNEEFKVPNVAMQFEVEEVVTVGNYDGDESKLVGRKHSEFVALPTFDGEQFSKAVGKLKAMAQKICGRDKSYAYANVPAILEDIAANSFSVKIKHGKYTNRNGEEVATEDFDLKTIKAN